MSTIRFSCFPQTSPPPSFCEAVVDVLRKHETDISTVALDKGLESNDVLAAVRRDLVSLGFEVESGKRSSQKIARPVFFGENGRPTLNYQIDAYQPEWRCGLEIEAGRAVYGNAIYRDLVQAMVMVQVDHLFLCVPNEYKHANGSHDGYKHTVAVAGALFGHKRVQIPYGLTVVGY